MAAPQTTRKRQYCIIYLLDCIQLPSNCMLYVLSSLWYGRRQRVYAMRQAFSLKQAIEDAVITGEFVPGDRLDEASLADRFGVSRTPIRDAGHPTCACSFK